MTVFRSASATANLRRHVAQLLGYNPDDPASWPAKKITEILNESDAQAERALLEQVERDRRARVSQGEPAAQVEHLPLPTRCNKVADALAVAGRLEIDNVLILSELADGNVAAIWTDGLTHARANFLIDKFKASIVPSGRLVTL
jgi:hypothetical protein